MSAFAKADISGLGLLPCKLTPELCFAGRKSPLAIFAATRANASGCGHSSTVNRNLNDPTCATLPSEENSEKLKKIHCGRVSVARPPRQRKTVSSRATADTHAPNCCSLEWKDGTSFGD
jgi:hypothetical protein